MPPPNRIEGPMTAGGQPGADGGVQYVEDNNGCEREITGLTCPNHLPKEFQIRRMLVTYRFTPLGRRKSNDNRDNNDDNNNNKEEEEEKNKRIIIIILEAIKKIIKTIS